MLIEVEGLAVRTRAGESLVAGVDLAVDRGALLLLAGESGAGKSLTALALGDLLPFGLEAHWRHRRLEGRELAAGAMTSRRGLDVGFVFQDPRASFHHAFRLGDQLDDAARIRGSSWSTSRAERRDLLAGRLATLGLAEPEAILEARPDEVSGGELQRVSLAAALLHDPSLLVLDEFTSQLDAPLRQQLLDLVVKEVADGERAAIVVSHDLNLVLPRVQAVAVMEAGRIVEATTSPSDLGAHPASRRLLDARPRAWAEGGDDV